MEKYFKRTKKYFAKHHVFSSLVHALGGIGFGILIARPVAGEHPLRWGVSFLALTLVGHWWAATR